MLQFPVMIDIIKNPTTKTTQLNQHTIEEHESSCADRFRLNEHKSFLIKYLDLLTVKRTFVEFE